MLYTIYHSPGPRQPSFGNPFVKNFMCPVFFPYGAGVEPGRLRSAAGHLLRSQVRGGPPSQISGPRRATLKVRKGRVAKGARQRVCGNGCAIKGAWQRARGKGCAATGARQRVRSKGHAAKGARQRARGSGRATKGAW